MAAKTKYTKTDLINAVHEEYADTCSKKQIREVIDTVLSKIEAMMDPKLAISDFGIFQIKVTKARVMTNPQTGAKMRVPAKRKVTFRPSVALKRRAL